METFYLNEHQNEIHLSRVGGLGGSDAKLFYKFRNNFTNLSESDLKRLDVMQGKRPYEPIPTTPAMQMGHDFENIVEKALTDGQGLDLRKEVKLSYSDSEMKGYSLFAHCDFVYNNDGNFEILECKYSRTLRPAQLATTYKHQLQYYYFLTDLLKIKNVIVNLVTLRDIAGDIAANNIASVIIDRDEEMIDNFYKAKQHLFEVLPVFDRKASKPVPDLFDLNLSSENVEMFLRAIQIERQFQEYTDLLSEYIELKGLITNAMKECNVDRVSFHEATFCTEPGFPFIKL